MSKWQPIETVPKDGTAILAYGPSHWGKNHMATVQFEDTHDCWASSDNWPWEDFKPTHWMPLPEPPEIKRRK